jgi:hypothetical protein
MKIKWTFGDIFFVGFMGLILFVSAISILYFFGIGIPKENRVCTFGDRLCVDAGSPQAAKATYQVIYQTWTAEPVIATEHAIWSATQTAVPIITTYGDITIQRFYDPRTGQFTVICQKAGQIIPCSIQDKETRTK